MDKTQMIKNLETALLMEYYGIHMETTKEIEHTTYYYITVPESSTMEFTDKELNGLIQTADGLIASAKTLLVEMLLESCKALGGDDKFIEHVKENLSEYIKVYAAIRKGEVWNKEMGEARIKEMEMELQRSMEYQEV